MRVRARPDAATAHVDAGLSGDASLDGELSPEALPEIEQLPEEIIDATVLVHTRPQVCLSNVIHDEPASGCGCRRAGSSSS